MAVKNSKKEKKRFLQKTLCSPIPRVGRAVRFIPKTTADQWKKQYVKHESKVICPYPHGISFKDKTTKFFPTEINDYTLYVDNCINVVWVLLIILCNFSIIAI